MYIKDLKREEECQEQHGLADRHRRARTEAQYALRARAVEHAARLLVEGGYNVDIVFTSRLKRAMRERGQPAGIQELAFERANV